MKTLMMISFLTTLIQASCLDPCLQPNESWGFDYDFKQSHTTEYGIKVDTQGQEPGVDIDERTFQVMDQMTKEVESCLQEVFPKGKIPDDATANKLFCHGRDIQKRCDKDCLEVVIPNSWSISELNPQQELLADSAPQEGCEAKGLPPGECKWRAGIQYGHRLIVTPNLFLYKDVLVKYMTGCDVVWTEPLIQCVRPGIEPDWNRQ